MLFCSSVATVGSAMATGSTGAERCSRIRWAHATITPASNAENSATETNCLAETLYIVSSSFEPDHILITSDYNDNVSRNPVNHPRGVVRMGRRMVLGETIRRCCEHQRARLRFFVDSRMHIVSSRCLFLPIRVVGLLSHELRGLALSLLDGVVNSSLDPRFSAVRSIEIQARKP